MRNDQRKIECSGLPVRVDSDLCEGDIQDASSEAGDIRGGLGKGIRVGQGNGVRAIDLVTGVTASSGDPGI